MCGELVGRPLAVQPASTQQPFISGESAEARTEEESVVPPRLALVAGSSSLEAVVESSSLEAVAPMPEAVVDMAAASAHLLEQHELCALCDHYGCVARYTAPPGPPLLL